MASRFAPKPASRKGQFARIALDGPTGSGKTWTALQFARVFAGPDGKVLLIDTERGSSQLYADLYDFDVIEWEPPYDPRELRVEMKSYQDDYAAIVVDSATHFWMGEGGTLDIKDAAAARSFKGNDFAGWQEATPAQNDLVDAFVTTGAHVIVTMRSKMEYVLDEKNRPVKVGLAPVQRAGLEYEFTLVGDLDLQHHLTVNKSRYDRVSDKVFKHGHSIELAEQMAEWLSTAEPWATAAQADDLRRRIRAISPLEARNELVRDLKAQFGVTTLDRLTVEQWGEAVAAVDVFAPSADAATANGDAADDDAPELFDETTTDDEGGKETPEQIANRIAAEIAEEEAARS